MCNKLGNYFQNDQIKKNLGVEEVITVFIAYVVATTEIKLSSSE